MPIIVLLPFMFIGGLIYLQIILCKRKEKWKGLILPFATIFIMLFVLLIRKYSAVISGDLVIVIALCIPILIFTIIYIYNRMQNK